MRTSFCLAASGLVASAAAGQVVFEDIRLAAPGVSAGDQFGLEVAIEGDLAVVGANRDNAPQSASGAVYVFSGTTGQYRARVIGSDTVEDNFFGDAVSVSGGRFFVGAPGNETAGFQAGAFYGFDGGSLRQDLRLEPFQRVFVGEPADFSFYGFSVDVDEQLIVVGAPGDIEGSNGGGGAVYIYNAADSSLVGKFFADDADFADNLGRTVATTDGFAIASSPFDDGLVQDTGAVYIFDGITGDQVRKISYPGSDASALFGLALAAQNGVVVVGAGFANFAGANSGVAYVYDIHTGVLLHTLAPSDIGPNMNFGFSVAVDGDLIAVGARGATDQGAFSGAAYVFDRQSGEQIAKLLPSDGEAGDVFGTSVGISGNRVLVGAPLETSAGDNAGAAYLFTINPEQPGCLADLAAPFGVLDFFDVAAFLAAYNGQDGAADLAEPLGVWDFFDVAAFLAAYNAGCP